MHSMRSGGSAMPKFSWIASMAALRCEVPGSTQFVLVEGLGSITNDGVHEGSFVTTLRNANVNVRTLQPRQILTDLRDVLGLLHNKDLTRYRLANVVENP